MSWAVVYISIGNSDDKLTQFNWSAFVSDVALAVQDAARAPGGVLHGQWLSEPASAFQNACWALQLPTDVDAIARLKERLAEIAGLFRQDSIAWAVAPDTEFIRPTS